MDIDLRKTATDTAYIVVGVGVLGFQQAQVRRREAGSKLGGLRKDARSAFETQAGSLKSRADELTGSLTSTVETFGTQLKGRAGAVRTVNPRQWIEPVVGDIKVRVEPVLEHLRSISLADTVQTLPEQVTKVIEVGRIRVQGLRRGTATAPTGVATATSTSTGSTSTGSTSTASTTGA